MLSANMKQIIFFLVVAVAFCYAADDDEPFSIGLGVLSPSYSQTIGKEKVKVKFDQKEDGRFSFSIGDPKTGTNQYLNFGPSAGQQQKPDERSSGYHVPALETGYQAPSSSYPSSGYQSSSYQPSSGFQGAPLAAGYQPPKYGYSGSPSSSYDQPSGYYRSGQESGFYGSGSSAPNKPESDMGGILPSGFSYHATEGQAFLRGSGELRKPQEQIMPAGFSYHATDGQAFLRGSGELRKPEGAGQIMPAGFSYHATEGQSFLRQGGSPNFAIAEPKQGSTGRGPAEESFYKNFQESSRPQQGGPYLKNGLIGYGPGGPSRKLPIGGYAGAEFQGAHEENGGHQ